VRVRIDDARAGLTSLHPASADLVVSDVYAEGRTPAHLTSVEVAHEGARVLRPGGTYAVNLADGPPLAFARSQLATLRAVFPQVGVLADTGVLRARRFGNLVAVASTGELPLDGLLRRAAADPMPTRVVHGEALRRFTTGAPVVTDATAVPSPTAPSPAWE
jgi:spermidine synthase